jgi:hypothetical protein
MLILPQYAHTTVNNYYGDFEYFSHPMLAYVTQPGYNSSTTKTYSKADKRQEDGAYDSGELVMDGKTKIKCTSRDSYKKSKHDNKSELGFKNPFVASGHDL